MNNKERYIDWLSTRYDEKNNTIPSYIKALEILSEFFLKNNIFKLENIDELNNLYEDLKKDPIDEFTKITRHFGYKFEKNKFDKIFIKATKNETKQKTQCLI